MAAFTPAITSSNRLEVVRLNRSISIFLIISTLFTYNRALIKLHETASVLLCSGLFRLRFSAQQERRGDRRRRRLKRLKVTAVADVEIRLSVRWRALPRR